MQINMPLWWSVVLVSALAFGLAACDSPSPAFSGQVARQVTVAGSTFSVRATSHAAEAVRINRELRARRAVIVAKGGVAIEQVTGCGIRKGSLDGDTNYVRARLNCPGAGAPVTQPATLLTCGFVSPLRKGPFGKTAEIDCDVLRGR